MSTENENNTTADWIGANRLPLAAAATFLVVAAATALLAFAPSKSDICSGTPERLVLVPSTSISDLKYDRHLTPGVAEQVVERAAESCGSVTVGIQNNRTAADLELVTMELEPAKQQAYNSNPSIRMMVEQGEQFVDENLLRPLGQVPGTPASPFFAGLAKIGEEIEVHKLAPATIVIVGDGIAFESLPSGKGRVDFTDREMDPELLREFDPMLKPLRGSTVILVGAGADSRLPDEVIRRSQAMLRDTIERAGARFVATRSSDLPPSESR